MVVQVVLKVDILEVVIFKVGLVVLRATVRVTDRTAILVWLGDIHGRASGPLTVDLDDGSTPA